MFDRIKFFLLNPENTPAILIITGCLIVFTIIQSLRLFICNQKIRKDAIKRSKAVIGGQVAEQIAPYLPDFPCSPSDAKFIGKPVDFIAFSGLSETDKVDEILLIEVKTGQSSLSSREREIKKAVKEGRVRYVEYRID